ncbi:MAG: hypothetical protein R3C01_13060 [Planctomycetaceae bacterium]
MNDQETPPSSTPTSDDASVVYGNDNTSTAVDEYRAAYTGVAVCDLSGRTQLEVTGADRVTFLHNFCTNDIRRLQPGEGCEAFVTNIKGRILGHVAIFAGETAHWIDSSPDTANALLAHLDRYIITEDVTLRDASDWGTLAMIGPKAAKTLTRLLGIVLPVDPWTHLALRGEGLLSAAAVRRVPMTRPDCYTLVARKDALGDIWTNLFAAGAVFCGSHAWDALRIESQYPRYGVDLSDALIAQEAGRTKQAISFTKGCYLGQEPIARLDALGHTNKELRGLSWDVSVAPFAGAEILESNGDGVVGTMTSAAAIPGEARGVGLGILKRDYLEPGTSVRIVSSEGPVTARVAPQFV